MFVDQAVTQPDEFLRLEATDSSELFYSAIDPLTGEKLTVRIENGIATAYLTLTRIIRQYDATRIRVVKCLGKDVFNHGLH